MHQDQNQNPFEEPIGILTPGALRSVIENGDPLAFYEAIKNLEKVEPDHLMVLTGFIAKANRQFQLCSSLKAALIQSLSFRKDWETLIKVALAAWAGAQYSPASIDCILAAVSIDQEQTYNFAHEMHQKSGLGSEHSRLLNEFVAIAVLRAAEAGCRDAWFMAGELLRDGVGVSQDTSRAARWFYRFAASGSQNAVMDLQLVSEAYEQVAAVGGLPPNVQALHIHQARIVSEAARKLSVLVPGEEIQVLIEGGEDADREFKSSLRWDVKESKKNPDLEFEVIKTVAAFLNTAGGTLLIGVNDEKKPVGLADDYGLFSKDDKQDAFGLYLGELLRNRLGHAYSAYWNISFHILHGLDVCRVLVRRSPDLVFCQRKGKQVLCVREYRCTLQLDTPARIEEWRKHHRSS